MSEARSLTPLSETDYEAIEAAVMETARGRWFMSEFARRNRQADTLQLLGALQRIERVVGTGLAEPAATPPAAEPEIGEAAALIADLRIDLERISGRAEERASGLAARIEAAAGSIVQATESIQEVAWHLREAGAGDDLCDRLDQRAAEISTATGIVDGTVQQIDKIADTIAMLDSSLRAVAGLAPLASTVEPFVAPMPKPRDFGLRESVPFTVPDDIEIIEIDDQPPEPVSSGANAASLLGSEPRIGSMTLLDEDVVFEEPEAALTPDHGAGNGAVHHQEDRAAGAPMAAASGLPLLGAEAALREIDAMSASRKLAYFG
jgi:hypothetical protein